MQVLISFKGYVHLKGLKKSISEITFQIQHGKTRCHSIYFGSFKYYESIKEGFQFCILLPAIGRGDQSNDLLKTQCRFEDLNTCLLRNNDKKFDQSYVTTELFLITRGGSLKIAKYAYVRYVGIFISYSAHNQSPDCRH